MKRTLAILISLFVISVAACDGDNGPGSLCGNGVIDTNNGEGCDPGAADPLGGATCETLGFNAISSGALKCNTSTCLFDTDECLGPIPCGDGSIEPGVEVCDGADLGGQMCQDEGLEAGTLACADGCVDFDRSGCGCTEDVDLGTWNGTAINETFDSCTGGTLYGNRNFACGTIGGWQAVAEEIVFKLTLPDGASVTAVHTGGPTTDTMIYVLSTCTDIHAASCLDGDDRTLLGQPETVVLTNATGADVTYYIVADGWEGCGNGSLDITGN